MDGAAGGGGGSGAGAGGGVAEDAAEQTVETLLEFFEVAIHSILLFERRRKYNVAVQMSRHPELNDYVFEVLNTAKPLFLKGQVERLDVVLMGRSGLPEERFVFEVDFGATSAVPCTYSELEDGLAAFLTKLSMLDAVLGDPRKDRTFTVLIHTHQVLGPGEKPASAAEEWVPVGDDDPELRPVPSKGGPGRRAMGAGAGVGAGAGSGGGSGGGSSGGGGGGSSGGRSHSAVEPAVIPLKSLRAGLMSLQLLVEASA